MASLSYLILPPHEKGQLEAFMPVYSDYQVQQEVRADEAMNQNRASKYIKCEIAAVLKRLKSVLFYAALKVRDVLFASSLPQPRAV